MARFENLATCFFILLTLLTAQGVEAESADDRRIVQIETGRLAGQRSDELSIFKGIPFAAPPVGDLRWRAPRAAAAWEGVREAREFGPACTQLHNPFTSVPDQAVSEDCLYLNVWTPDEKATEKLPVIVWIHGGGFSFGSTAQPLFNGAELAKQGVVFVSPSYRVGPFGFFAHPGLSAEALQGTSGNYGLLDQIAALRWVQRNVEAFGGDPDNVTIMGESAGAFSVNMLAASPLTRNLFHRVIAESGGWFSKADTGKGENENMMTLEVAEALGQTFADSIGATTTSQLREIPAETLLEQIPRRSVFIMQSSWPVLDGYVVPGQFHDVFAAAEHNDTPVLIGSNAAEGSLFVMKSSLADYRSFVDGRFGDYAEHIFAAYPAENDVQALTTHQNLMRDLNFGWHMWTWARLQSQYGKGPVYNYYFNHSPPQLPGRPNLGPTHAAEMQYVFRHPYPNQEWRPVDEQLSIQMSRYWVNFARTGNPNGDGLPDWPAWTNNSPHVLHFDQKPRVGSVANLEQLRAIDAYLTR